MAIMKHVVVRIYELTEAHSLLFMPIATQFLFNLLFIQWSILKKLSKNRILVQGSILVASESLHYIRKKISNFRDN